MCPSHPDPSTIPSCLQTQEIAEQAPPEPNYTYYAIFLHEWV